ncbi:Ferrihemoglobin_reductase [Hexamita inflata]|uniref:Ferrihemoglobin reductase n=1 Tax=Hexamita inflata TaxID=28002 RepID=A0AA86N6L6_9EUKA|nr:Ferrihemoglobin reductase [Hexamita inflata]
MDRRMAVRKQMLEEFFKSLEGRNLLTKQQASEIRIKPEEVCKHNNYKDAWFSFRGYVYDVTPYNDFHPGGLGCFAEFFGYDVTNAVMVHRHVNIESYIGKLVIGILDGEPLLPNSKKLQIEKGHL